MAANKLTMIITAISVEELDKQVQLEIIAQGWNADGAVVKNSDNTFSQKMEKSSAITKTAIS